MLELDDVSRRYGGVVALDGLSFEVGAGQLFGFVGANGAGKTTAMRIVVGLERTDHGQVRWRGEPVDAAARARFGYLPEERGLYPKLEARWQLAYFARLRGVDRSAAEQAATTWLERLGLGERADEPVENLSLGNQQRVQLAAAMVHDPELLLLDEPFSGLDPTGVDALSDMLVATAASGVAVVFSSHQLELVERLCDAVAIIDSGRLVASGGVDELRQAGRRQQWRVDVADAGRDWTGDLPGARVAESRDGSVVVELDGSVDPQQLLDAARAAGRVIRFAPVVPTLAERYRHLVAGDSP